MWCLTLTSNLYLKNFYNTLNWQTAIRSSFFEQLHHWEGQWQISSWLVFSMFLCKLTSFKNMWWNRQIEQLFGPQISANYSEKIFIYGPWHLLLPINGHAVSLWVYLYVYSQYLRMLIESSNWFKINKEYHSVIAYVY